jgi:hypothetical protein
VAWEGPADLCTRVPRPIAGSILTIISKPLALSPAGWRLRASDVRAGDCTAQQRRLRGRCEALRRPVCAPELRQTRTGCGKLTRALPGQRADDRSGRVSAPRQAIPKCLPRRVLRAPGESYSDVILGLAAASPRHVQNPVA